MEFSKVLVSSIKIHLRTTHMWLWIIKSTACNRPPRKRLWTIKSIAIDHQNKGLWTIKCFSFVLVENPRITLLIRPLERCSTKFLSDLTYFKKIILSFNYNFIATFFRRICLFRHNILFLDTYDSV